MSGRAPVWHDYATIFAELAKILRSEWKIEMPSYETLPSLELELAIDAWCMMFALNLNQAPDLDPPQEVRPWLLARLVMVAGLAATLQGMGDAQVPPLKAASIVQLLCGEWNGALREKWKEIGQMKWRERWLKRARYTILAIFIVILIAGAILALRLP